MIKGITVYLYDKELTGTDPFGKPVYEEVSEPIEVENVLVTPASSQEIMDSQELYGKKATYTLAIPKGDTNNWEDRRVRFFDEDWQTFGIPLEGIEDLIPLDWNMKVTVARYE